MMRATRDNEVCDCPELAKAISGGIHVGCRRPMAKAYDTLCRNCKEPKAEKCSGSPGGEHVLYMAPVRP